MDITGRYIRLRIIAAEPERLLTKLLDSNIELIDVISIDFLTVEVKIRKSQYGLVSNIVEHSGATCRLIGRMGMLWSIQSLLKRPVLMLGILMLLLSSCMLNGRVFFVTVSGNENVPERVVLSAAEDCGIGFGAKASKVRSEDIKNMLLKQLPQLQWVGVTTSGSVATIHVKERSVQDSVKPAQQAVSSILASRDGVISKMTVHNGTPLVQVGQSVQAGDLLVSGYTDCGIVQLGEQADAEIYAYTFRKIEAITPTPDGKKEAYTNAHTCTMIRIGKKVINFCNHSGISDATCVKMYEEDYVTLPGGFRLPVSVIRMRTYASHIVEAEYDPEASQDWLSQYVLSYTGNQMIAGSILNEKWQWDASDGYCLLKGDFACHEMIGQVKFEEIIEEDAEDN